ncbi:hypothetical protein ABPG74_003569 [Tetrahymena malaccensis]
MSEQPTQNLAQQLNQAEKKKLQGVSYRVMVNLPVIIKDKEIIDRKLTIDIFKRKAATNQKQTQQKKHLQMKKTAQDQIGRIYINELWSDKFHKLVMNESKIQEVLDKIQKLYRRNVDEFVEDVHNAAQSDKKTDTDDIIQKHIEKSSLPYILKNNSSLINNISKNIETDTIQDDQEEVSIIRSNKSYSTFNKRDSLKNESIYFLLNRKDSELDNLEKQIKQKFLRSKKDNNLSKPKFQIFENPINPTFLNNAQNILSQCKQINEEWEINKQLQRRASPFYTVKEDRY